MTISSDRLPAAPWWAVGVVLFVCMGAPKSYGQIVHGQRPELLQGLTFMSWDVKGDTQFTIQEWHVPILARAPLGENFELAVSTGLLNASTDWDVQDDAIDGLTDSKIQISASFLEDQLLASAGVSLPTGRQELNADEQVLLLWLTSDFLNFPVKNPGEGLNLFGQVGVAAPAGEWIVGASGAAYIVGEYTPYEASKKYRPGSRFIVDVGAHRQWHSGSRVETDVIVIYSTDDQLEGRPVYRDGIQLDSRLQASLAAGRGVLEAGIRYIIRTKDKIPDGSESLVSEINNRHGNDLRIRVLGRLPFGQLLSAWASVDAKFLAANDYQAGLPFSEDAARLAGVGGGLDFVLSGRSKAGIGIKGWTGSSDGALGVDKLDLTGLEISQYVSLTF